LKYFQTIPPGGRSWGISQYLHPEETRYKIALTISRRGYISVI